MNVRENYAPSKRLLALAVTRVSVFTPADEFLASARHSPPVPSPPIHPSNYPPPPDSFRAPRRREFFFFFLQPTISDAKARATS